ncbi:MAG: MFS transporter [Candidatus Desulfaltia sp.]|nr:MFS transporter [Candidatus Desulfaltia sp.]
MHSKKLFLLIFLSLAGFVTSFGAYIVAANLPSYSKETGAGLITIGILIAIYDLAEIILKPMAGVLSKKIGEWAVLRLGLMLFLLASGLYLIIDPSWLFLIRWLQGAGAAFFSVMSTTLLVRYFMDRKGMALGLYGGFKSSGYVLAPTIGGVFVYFHGFKSIFILCACVALLILILSYIVRLPAFALHAPELQKRNKKKVGFKSLVHSIKNRETLPAFLIIFFNMIFLGAFFGFVPVLLSSKGLGPAKAGIILTVNAVVFLAVQPLLGRLSDTMGRKKLIATGLILSTLSLCLLPFLGSPFYIVACLVLAVGIGCVSPLCDAFIGDVSDEEDLAVNLGISGAYRELGEMVGPVSMGFIGQTVGLGTAFLFVGIIGAGSLLCLRFLKEKNR